MAILLVDALAVYLCIMATPWKASPVVACFILLKGLVPLSLLAGLAYRVRSVANQEWKRLDEDSGFLATLPSRSKVIEEIQTARRRVLNEANPPHSEATFLNLPKECLIALALERVQQQYVAGEKVSLESVEQTIDEHALERAEPLQRFHELALALGFAGTVLGLAVQGYFAQSFSTVGILSNVFLTGFMMATTSTFVGIVVAAYARTLRSRLIQGLDQLRFAIVRHLSYEVLPSCDPESRAIIDLSDMFQGTVDRFAEQVDAMATKLDTTLSEAAGKVITRIEASATNNFIEALKTQVLNRFEREVKEIGTSLTTGAQGIQSTTLMLSRKTDELKAALTVAAKLPGDVSRDMLDAGAEIKGLVRDIELVRQNFETLAGLLSSANQELILSISNARDMESDMRNYFARETGGVREMTAELKAAAEVLRQAVNAITRAFAAIDHLRQSSPDQSLRAGN
jgi:hypothetical protein